MHLPSIYTSISFIVCLSFFSGCSEEQETYTYTVPKEHFKGTSPTPPVSEQGPVMQALPGMEVQSSQFAVPTFNAPDHWQAQPLGSMRKGSWKVSDGDASADISILVFPGDVGGDLANINRWRNQIGLPAIDEASLDESTSPINADGLSGKWVRLINTSTQQGILGVILPKGKATWFFKMQGDQGIVEQEQANFKKFVEQTQFQPE